MDPRVARTRSALTAAVLELLDERALADVSVAAVCTRAGVSRVTFYEHFPTRDALLVEVMESSLAHVTEAAAAVDVSTPRPADEPPADLVEVFRRVGAHAPLYLAMLGDGGSILFLRRMRDALGEAVVVSLRRMPEDPALWPVSQEAYVDYVAGATLSALMGWLERDPHARHPRAAARDFWWLLTHRPERLAALPQDSVQV